MLIPNILGPMAKLAPEENRRYVINGVRVERDEDGKAVAVVTDGKVLLIAQFGEQEMGVTLGHVKGFAYTVPAKIWRSAFLWAKRLCRPVTVFENDASPAMQKRTIAVNGGGESLCWERKAEAGNFPNWREIVKASDKKTLAELGKDKYVRCSLDISLFLNTLTVLQEIGFDRIDMDWSADGESPCRFIGKETGEDDGVVIRGFIMPLKKEGYGESRS